MHTWSTKYSSHSPVLKPRMYQNIASWSTPEAMNAAPHAACWCCTHAHKTNRSRLGTGPFSLSAGLVSHLL